MKSSILMTKVIITGVTGFIGRGLAKRLLQSGTKVYGVGREQKKLDEMTAWGDFVPVIADFEDYSQLHKLISDRDFDMLCHLAWQGTTSTTADYKDYNIQIKNIQASCDAAMAAANLQCKGCACSSSYQQGSIKINSDDRTTNPILYGTAKKCASDMFMALAYKHKISCKNLILPNIYGIDDKLNTAIVFFIKQMLADEAINLISGVHQDDWVYIDDLIDGILCAVTSEKKYADYYIGRRNITTFKDKLVKMKSILNSKSELLFGTYSENYRVDYSQFDLGALFHDTGYEPKTDFTKSIIETAGWIKSL
ncbi:MAG: NAD(P)-dependent oxidoreductase [Defluviitaleaceae bacterium]|nr:NAD(P)-dependent oxidoreductase [Defluviitaleaceae bacterium]